MKTLEDIQKKLRIALGLWLGDFGLFLSRRCIRLGMALNYGHWDDYVEAMMNKCKTDNA